LDVKVKLENYSRKKQTPPPRLQRLFAILNDVVSVSLEKGLSIKKKLERLDHIRVNLYKVYNELI
jgi:hypothetical protein